MLDDRKKRVLQAIVEEYINTAEPVSSANVVKNYQLGFSSATIRNDMAELEDVGFLDKPHTSAGRIPSHKGYRFYVDELLKEDNISMQEMQYIEDKLQTRVNEILDLTKITTVTLSELTNYTTVSIVTEDSEDIYFKGANKVFDFPEFRQIDVAKHFFDFIETKEMVKHMLESGYAKDINVYIGNENKYDELKDFSVVTYKNILSDKNLGAIGIIGPTRMDYSKVISIMRYISNYLNGD